MRGIEIVISTKKPDGVLDENWLPIIFITGHGDIDMAVGALKSGAVDFIQKPYHEQNLLDSINDALQLDTRNRNFSNKQMLWNIILKNLPCENVKSWIYY